MPVTFSFSQLLRAKEHQNLSGKLRPSGRFSVIQLFPKKSKAVKSAQNQSRIPNPLRSLQQIDESYAAILSGEYIPMQEMSTTDGKCEGTIGLSDAAISPKRAGRGSKGIGARQRDILCWGASTLEAIYGRATLSFLTCTLPPLSREDLASVKENWHDITHRVQLRIKEKLSAKGITTSIAGCVELQLERYQNTGDIYPHLHLVFRGRKSNSSDWAVKSHQFRQIWRQCVGKYLLQQNYDWRASENVQPVRKSVSGYLAKYVSKCASKAEPGLLSSWHPKDWILLSRKLRKLYESMSYVGYDMAELLFAIVRSWRPDLGYVSRVFIVSSGYGERCIGFVGWLRGEIRFPTYLDVHGIT